MSHKNWQKENKNFKLKISNCNFKHQTKYLYRGNKIYFSSSIFTCSSLLYKSKRDSHRPKYTLFFYSILIETTHKPSKVAASKVFFSSVYVIDATCFHESFLFQLITGRYYFLIKDSRHFEIFQPPCCSFPWNKCFVISLYFTLYAK